MHEAALVRYRTHTDGVIWYNTVTVGGARIYDGPSHLDLASANGELADIKDWVTDLRCAFCGDPAGFITEITSTDVQGFCSELCHKDALVEADALRVWEMAHDR
jgi:hypothetical protein